jgi:hypothetical protein
MSEHGELEGVVVIGLPGCVRGPCAGFADRSRCWPDPMSPSGADPVMSDPLLDLTSTHIGSVLVQRHDRCGETAWAGAA